MNMDGADAPKKPDTYRKPIFRRPTRRCTYIIVGVTILCIILCIVLAVQLSRKSKSDCPEGIHCDWRSMPHSEFLKDARCGDALCTTRPCIRAAHYALSRIDTSKDPCEDFYEFACGTYEQETLLFPEESEGISTYQEMDDELLLNLKEVIDSITGKPGNKGFALRLAKRVYDDCINTDHHSDVLTKTIWKKMFADNGMLPWPLVSGRYSAEQRYFVKMMSTSLFYKVNPFFEMSGPNEETVNNKTSWSFRFRESDDLDFLKTIYDSDDDDENSLSYKYAFSMAKIVTEVGMDADEIKSVLPNVTELEEEFVTVTSKAMESNEKVYEKNNHLRYEYHNHSCQKLDHDMENIKWCKIVEQLRADYGLSKKHDIRIELPALQDYFDAVNGVLGHFLDRDIVNFIALKFVMGYMKYMPSPLRELYYRDEELFPRIQDNYMDLSTRWQQCVDVISEIMWVPLEKEYIRQKFDEEKIAKVQHLVKKSKETYASLVDKTSWLKAAMVGEDPKKMIREIELVIGRFDVLLLHDDTALDNYFASASSKSVLVNPSNPLISDVLEIKKLNEKAYLTGNQEIQILREEASQLNLNSFKRKIEPNKIVLPYQALHYPMYLPGRPMFAEYANLGSFVFTYMSYLLVLNTVTSGRNASFNMYLKSAKCLQEQSHLYRTGKFQFRVEPPSKPRAMSIEDTRWMYGLINTLSTLGSFQAYTDYLKENEDKGLPGLPFTNKQLFFIAFAQMNCEKFTEKGYADYPPQLFVPARFRVNVPLANSKAFSEAFRCPSGSSLNPKRKCCIFGDGTLSHDCK